MKTYDERKQRVKVYMKRARARRIVWNCVKTTASMACLVAIIVGLLHIPYGQQNTSVIPTECSSNPSQTPSTGVPTEPTVPIGTEIPPDDTTPNDPPEPTEPVELIHLTIWAPDDQMCELVERLIKEFNGQKQLDYQIEADILLVEPQVAEEYISKQYQVPDLAFIDQSGVNLLATQGYLTSVEGDDADFIAGNNDSFSVEAASYQGSIYGMPAYHTDGYLLYYDRSVISADEASSLEAIIAACEAADRKFCFNLDSGYYQASFFFATGCRSDWYHNIYGGFAYVDDTFSSRKGILSLNGMQKLLFSSCYITPGQVGVDAAYNQSAAVVSSVWDYAKIASGMGGNMAVAKLPSFRVGEEIYQLGSFASTVMLAIPVQEDPKREMILTELGKFLTSETAQLDIYNEVGYIPTNVSAHSALRGTDFVDAYLEQSAFAVPLRNVSGHWWGILDQIPDMLAAYRTPEEVLVYYLESLNAIFRPATPRWSVIGDVNGSNWRADYYMYEQSEGIFCTETYLHFEEDTQFRIRYDCSWDTYLGGGGMNDDTNICPGVTGDYYVIFNSVECTWSLMPA